MELYSAILSLLVENLIRGIFISVLVIILVKFFFKGKINVDNAIITIKWMLIGYAILTLLLYVMLLFSLGSDIWFKTQWARATAEYRFAFWLMVAGSFSPLLLFIRKIGRNVYWILLFSILVNIGWIFETLIIHLVSFHRDYVGAVDEDSLPLVFNREFIIVAKGLIVGILVIFAGNLRKSLIK